MDDDEIVVTSDVLGYEVEAMDGDAGTVQAVAVDAYAVPCLIVKPGRLRAQHVIPATAVRRVDRRRHRLVVNLTRHQIRQAPEPWELDPGVSTLSIDEAIIERPDL